MAETSMLPTWRLTLTNREFLVVLKALGGRLGEAEVAEAEALGDQLTAQRVGNIKSMNDSAAKLEGNLNESN